MSLWTLKSLGLLKRGSRMARIDLIRLHSNYRKNMRRPNKGMRPVLSPNLGTNVIYRPTIPASRHTALSRRHSPLDCRELSVVSESRPDNGRCVDPFYYPARCMSKYLTFYFSPRIFLYHSGQFPVQRPPRGEMASRYIDKTRAVCIHGQ